MYHTNVTSVLIIFLIAAIIAGQISLIKAYKEIGRLSGRQEVLDSFAATSEDGTCYARGGCK